MLTAMGCFRIARASHGIIAVDGVWPSGKIMGSESHVETHIPAVEPCAQAASRVPRAHGHEGRAQDPERPSRAWPQKPERLIGAHPLTGTSPAPPPTNGSPGAFCVLKRRPDFLRAARGRRVVRPGFILQGVQRPPDDTAGDAIRIGFTCSKKVGNAVARNRAKRRLREIARMVVPGLGRPGWDYVLVGRAGATADLPFTRLYGDLESALRKIHG